MKNMLKTTVLLAALTGLMIVIGRVIGGPTGMVIAFLFAIILNFGSYWYSDKIVLKMYRAKEVSPAEAPNLHRIVDGLVMRAGIPKPKVYIVDLERQYYSCNPCRCCHNACQLGSVGCNFRRFRRQG